MNIGKEIALLKGMTVTELRKRYVEVFAEESRSRHKDYYALRSQFREPPTAHRLQPWMVAPAGRNSPPELSDSLLNRPRWVNNSVHLGSHRRFELVRGK